MTVLIDDRSQNGIPVGTEELLKRAIVKSLNYEKKTDSYEISISFVDNVEIRQINKQFRQIDKETDVLSFPQLTFEDGEVAEKNENGEIVLGDIIISIEKAEEQAGEYGHTLERELAFLTVHSMLHLLGYDHMEIEEEKEMFQKQKEILEQAGFFR